MLRRHVEAAGSLRKFAAASGVSFGYIHAVLQGRRPPGENVLNAIGLTKSAWPYERLGDRRAERENERRYNRIVAECDGGDNE